MARRNSICDHDRFPSFVPSVLGAFLGGSALADRII
jgi:hypothetical protein